MRKQILGLIVLAVITNQVTLLIIPKKVEAQYYNCTGSAKVTNVGMSGGTLLANVNLSCNGQGLGKCPFSVVEILWGEDDHGNWKVINMWCSDCNILQCGQNNTDSVFWPLDPMMGLGPFDPTKAIDVPTAELKQYCYDVSVWDQGCASKTGKILARDYYYFQ